MKQRRERGAAAGGSWAKMLDINLFREEKGGNPELVRESQRRRYASVEIVNEVIRLDKEWRQRMPRSFAPSLPDFVIASPRASPTVFSASVVLDSAFFFFSLVFPVFVPVVLDAAAVYLNPPPVSCCKFQKRVGSSLESVATAGNALTIAHFCTLGCA